MKKVLCLFTFLGFCLFFNTVSAQNIRNSIVFGASASQIDGDQLAGYNKAGLVLGGSSNFKITDKISFQPEILFFQKGSKTTDKNDYYLKWRLNYVSVPVLLCYKIQPKIVLQGGMSADYLLSANDDSGNGFEDRTDEFQKFDLNYAGGIEYQFTNRFAVNARYQYSVQWLDDLHFKNNNVVVSLRVALGGNE